MVGAAAGAPRAPRALVVATVVHRLSVDGGVQTVVRSLAAGVDPCEVDLHVVTVRPASAADRLEEVPATVHPIGHATAGYRWWQRPLVAWRAVLLLRSIRPDVVHLHSGTLWLGVLVPLLLRRCGMVVEVHDAPGSGRHGAWTDRFEGWFVRHCRAAVVVHSTSVAADVRRAWSLAADTVRLVPLAVDTDRFVPLDDAGCRRVRRSLDLGGGVVVLVAGRLVRSKRVDLVLEAVAATHDVQLLVVGHGELQDELERRAEGLDLGSRVRFAGFVDDDVLPALFASADLVASASEYEGFGLTLVEAMACGLPVVATAVGGVTDVVEHGVTGSLVPLGDVAAMAEQICLLADDAGLRARWGGAGRRRAVERFSLRALGTGFTEAYRAAVGEQGRPWGG